MATFAAVNNGDGTATLQVRGVAAGATQVRIGFGTYAYNNSALDILDNSCLPGTNSYTCTFLNSSGGSVGSLSTSANVTWPPGSVSAQSSGPYSGCAWSVPDDNNVDYTFLGTTLYYSINGGTFQQYGGSNAFGLSGNIGEPIYVGYNVTVTWEAVVTWAFSGHSNAVSSPSGSATTPSPPPPPPAAPNPPTNLRITADTGSSVSIAWDASVGGATGYEISRSVNGGAWTVLTTQAGTTYTDGASGSTRPIAYSVRAYNSDAGGTTYSASVTVGSAAADSCGVLVG